MSNASQPTQVKKLAFAQDKCVIEGQKCIAKKQVGAVHLCKLVDEDRQISVCNPCFDDKTSAGEWKQIS